MAPASPTSKGHKRLVAVAHSLAHSYLSVKNYVDDDYVVEHIRRAATAAGVFRVNIDVLGQAFDPPEIATPVLARSLVTLKIQLRDLCASEGVDLDVVRAATIGLVFHPDRPYRVEDVPDEGWLEYDCVARIVDDRGKTHEASVPEWWKY